MGKDKSISAEVVAAKILLVRGKAVLRCQNVTLKKGKYSGNCF